MCNQNLVFEIMPENVTFCERLHISWQLTNDRFSELRVILAKLCFSVRCFKVVWQCFKVLLQCFKGALTICIIDT